MKSLGIKILFLLVVFLAPGLARAESFKMYFQEQVFELKEEQITQLQGNYHLPAHSNLTYQKPPQEILIKKIFAPSTKYTTPDKTVNFSPEEVFQFVKQAQNAVEKPAQEPELKIQDNRAINFKPPQDGIIIDTVKSSLDILNSLQNTRATTSMAYSTTSPTTQLSSLNSQGINELIARGVSNFKGSPKNRRHNIKIGVEKFQGLIIKQGEEFSFNKYLGPVEKEQGFLPELVIKKSGTVPELGGGLCQVSSTTFRAAMEAGLKITQRKNHAYAVQYYSPQGTDATIYPGIVDLKFVNDTPGDILVWPHFVGNDDLFFDFYGTRDNRQITLSKPRQYERKSDGSMKAEWIQTVTKDGVTSTSTFKSIYQPPALFHKEEQFVSAAPTPTPTPADAIKPEGIN